MALGVASAADEPWDVAAPDDAPDGDSAHGGDADRRGLAAGAVAPPPEAGVQPAAAAPATATTAHGQL